MAYLIPDNLASRKDVPDAIRRVARAFAVALEDDATVWYEPLFDPEGRHPHLVVLEPRIGVAVLEVFIGKDRSRLLGAVRGKLRVDVDGQERELDNPLERADALAATLREALTDHATLSGVPVGAATAFSGVDRAEAERLGLDRLVDLDMCLFKPDLDAAIGSAESRGLLRLLTRAVGSVPEEELSDQQVSELRGVIHPDVVISRAPTQGALFTKGTGAEGDAIKVLDRRQEAFAKSLGSGHRVIRGVAGSGKTLVLVHRARLMARLLPNRKILVTCFTRSLASLLRELLADQPNVEVVSIGQLMYRVIRNAGMRQPSYDDGGAQVARVALEALLRTNGHRYRAVMIDEAQDFGTETLQFCVALLEATDPDQQDLIIVADSAQNIFRKNFRWKDAGIRAQGRARLLRVNYRNTREILEFAHSFLTADPSISVDEVPNPEDELSIIPAESAERSRPVPTVHVAGDAHEEVRLVVEAVQQAYSPRAPSRSIAVLHGDQPPGTRYLPRSIMKALDAASIPAFWVTDPTQKQNRDRAGSADEAVIVSTIHSAKGLEFPHVVVCCLGARDDLTTARKLLYVGFTRAVDRLTVVAAADSPFRHDVEQAATLV
jgi:hypothetical protein